jgi:cytoskeletal protein RodZ
MTLDIKFTDILNMSALGDKLREVRESKGLTIAQVQKQTRIHHTVLKALEEGKCGTILNPAYEKSFLKKYAEHLGIDSLQVTNEYKRLRSDTEPGAANKPPDTKERSRNLSAFMPFIKFIIIGAVAIALAAFAIEKINSYRKRPHPPKRAVVASKAKRTVPQGKTPAKKVSQAAAAKDALAEMAIPKTTQIKLLLKVNRNVLVKMKTDGVLLFERVLPKGTAEMFRADKAINIFTANGESIELIVNGKFMGSPGKGILKNIEITRSGIKIK